MGLIKDLKTKTVEELANVENAAYPGDPSGTDANDVYFEGNVHNYLHEIGLHINPDNVFNVSPGYADLQDPDFETIVDAHAASTGSSSSNRRLIKVEPGIYSGALNMNMSGGYIILKGAQRNACQITGNIAVSNGVYVFEGFHIEGNITVSGGVAVFVNCTQKTGNTALSAGATLLLASIPYWGYITAVNDSNTLYLENVKDMAKDGSSRSIYLDSTVTAGDYSIDDVRCQGTFTNSGSIAIGEGAGEILVSGLKENRRARPQY